MEVRTDEGTTEERNKCIKRQTEQHTALHTSEEEERERERENGVDGVFWSRAFVSVGWSKLDGFGSGSHFSDSNERHCGRSVSGEWLYVCVVSVCVCLVGCMVCMEVRDSVGLSKSESVRLLCRLFSQV